MGAAKYDSIYRASPSACGAPFEEFVAFVEALGVSKAEVLDLGCGQGRDSLLFARRGHVVTGVDLSSVGVAQLLATARREGLTVRGLVADIQDFEPDQPYDVVLLDRVLHMLATPEARARVLEKAAEATRPGGHVLVADGPTHRDLIVGCFERLGWRLIKSTRSRTFARRPGGPSSDRGLA